MSFNSFNLPSQRHYCCTSFLPIESVANGVRMPSTAVVKFSAPSPKSRQVFDQVLNNLRLQRAEAYQYRHIAAFTEMQATFNGIGEARILAREWYELDILSRATTATERKKLDLITQVAKALAHLHRHDTVHGHIHPGNIFLDNGDGVIVADASLHMLARASMFPADRVHTDASSVYQAPEALDPDEAVLESSTDVYSLGSIIYAVMTGRPPLDASSIESIQVSVWNIKTYGHSRIPRPPAIGLDLWRIVTRCWAWAAVVRPTMKDIVDDLEDILIYMPSK
ncbi:hypothetical protein DXG01_007548 [Tephrocybe rancida]|nr:hypothetical protein DXG01_007548 [Tephrocybe rancida]